MMCMAVLMTPARECLPADATALALNHGECQRCYCPATGGVKARGAAVGSMSAAGEGPIG